MRIEADWARDVAATFDLKSLPPDFCDDPFPYYRALRLHAPVKRMADGSILLTRYADCASVYEDHETFSSDKKIEFGPKYGDTMLFEHHTTSLVFNDNPYHGRVRRLMMGAMIPRAIAYMEPALVELVDRLMDEAEEKGEFDAIPEFAGAIPVEIIGNLLAIPGEARGPLRDWSLAILGALEPTLSAAQRERGEAAVRDFLTYLRDLLEARRRTPGDPNIDVLTRLIMGDAQGALSERELLHNCIFLLNAGHETTTNLIGNGLWLLCRFPDQRLRLALDQSLIRSAIEEMLRFESSNQLGNRITKEKATIGDVRLPLRTPVTLCIGAANRDPQVFDDPETFDVSRSPNRHLAFGAGIHQCAGMNLARLEARIALQRFLARFPNYELSGPPKRSGRVRFRGFTSLPLRLGAWD